MCQHCLLLEVDESLIEHIVPMIRFNGLLFGGSRDAIEESVLLFRVTRSPAYLPPSIKACLDETMYTDRHS